MIKVQPSQKLENSQRGYKFWLSLANAYQFNTDDRKIAYHKRIMKLVMKEILT
jgi:hypothetical protein